MIPTKNDLASKLTSATGQRWTWNSNLWGYCSQDGHFILVDNEACNYRLKSRPDEAPLSEWWQVGPGEGFADFESRVADLVAAILSSSALR